jgi:EpsG family
MKSSIKKFKLIFSLFLVVVFGWAAGWRDFGFDRENYINIYNGVVASNDIYLKFWLAKDLVNLILIEISNYFSEDPRLVFLITCTLSFYLKYSAVIRLAPGCVIYFMLLYVFLLAPGLEFAAIRSGMAIGFLMIAIANVENKIRFYACCLFALASHVSMFLVVFFMLPLVNKFFQKNKWALIFCAFAPLVISDFLIDIFAHGEDYKDNKGSLLAYSLPLVSLIICWMIFKGWDGKFQKLQTRNLSNAIYIDTLVYSMVAVSFGFSSVLVTVATRYLEVAWCFMLMFLMMRIRRGFINNVGFWFFFLFLCAININRLTWLAILDPNFSV